MGAFYYAQGEDYVAIIQNTLKIEIYPTVPELCEVINAVLAFYPGQEEQVLQAVQDAINKRLEEIKESEQNGKHA